MSWLNINQSLSSLKGQITNFASEVLIDTVSQGGSEEPSSSDSVIKDLEEKCRSQELEIAALKKLTDELQASLQSERLNRKNGVKEEDSNWYWDPSPQASAVFDPDDETKYDLHIQAEQQELSAMKNREVKRTNNEEEINRLKEENKNLTTSLEDLDSQHQMAMERLLVLKKELQKNFEVLKQEHEELKSANDEYAAEIKHLLHKLSERDEEIVRIKSAQPEYDTLFHKYQNLERVHAMLRENAEKFQEENQDLHEEVFKLQEQVTKLEHDVEIASKEPNLANTVSKEQYDNLLKQLNDLKTTRLTDQVHLDEVNIDDNAKSVIETLKRDINELKHRLAQRENENNDADNKTIKSDKIMQLYNKYISFDLPVDYVGSMPSPTDNIVLYKLENVFKTINAFKKEIDILQHKLSEKSLTLNHMQTQIEDLTSENEYLTTDMQHIESELDEMKKNNDFLISEIATLKNASKLEPIEETHEDNLAKLENELADCNRINKTFESEIKRIESELLDVNTEKKKLQDTLNDMREKYTSMLSELENFKTQTIAVQQLEYSNSNQNISNNNTLEEINNLKKRLNTANTKNEQHVIDIHIIENDKVLLTKEIDDLKHALESSLHSQKELESMRIVSEHKVEELKEIIEKINAEKQVLVKENQTLIENLHENGINVSEIIRHEKGLDSFSKNLNRTVNDNSIPLNMATKEIADLNIQCQGLIEENTLLKQKLQAHGEIRRDELSILNKELEITRQEKQDLRQKQIQLEMQLATNNEKLTSMEDEFEKINNDFKEKDSVIEKLNITLTDTQVKLSNLTQNMSDLTQNIRIKEHDIAKLEENLATVSEELKITNANNDRAREELEKLHKEKDDTQKQIEFLNDKVNEKNNMISRLKEQIQEFENSRNNYEEIIYNKEKEIKELNETILELKDTVGKSDNSTVQTEECIKLKLEKDNLDKAIMELKNELESKHRNLTEVKDKAAVLENNCIELKTSLDNATHEKTELINLVNLKHNESIQYHSEIQRLNQVILEQTNEFKRIIEERDSALRRQIDNCSDCQSLRNSLKEKEDIIMSLSQNKTDTEKLKAELVNESETIRNLTKRCEELEKNLSVQLETIKKLTVENSQLSENEQISSRELERLRQHLVEMEENYTQELMTSEQKLGECQLRLQQVEERAKQTSTVYTSNSIRANQEVETLRNQIKLLEKQREEVQARLSDADDARSRSEAALTNLQIVLEQFQLDKEREIQAATEKIRNKLEQEKYKNESLQREIAHLHSKLEESLAGLQAASRLGGQVETKTAQINDLKEQVRTLQTSVAAAEERYYNAISNQQDKVDKNLVKNLVVNYVMTGQNNLNRTQTLRILSTVLDFNQQECEKLGLIKSSNATDSLAAEFVKFLQNESRPRAPLPDMMGLQAGNRAASVSSSRKSSTISPHPTIEINHKRNPSTGSNNLLFQNLDNVETTSQISTESETRVLAINPLETGINQTRNNEGAILKHVLKDM